MSTSWEEVRKSIHEFFSAAAEKTDEFIKVGKRKLSIAEIRRSMASHYAELGGRVYHLIRQGRAEGIGSDGEVESLVSRIQKLEDELKAKEIEIEEIRVSAGQTTEETVPPAGSAEAKESEASSGTEGSGAEKPDYH